MYVGHGPRIVVKLVQGFKEGTVKEMAAIYRGNGSKIAIARSVIGLARQFWLGSVLSYSWHNDARGFINQCFARHVRDEIGTQLARRDAQIVTNR